MEEKRAAGILMPISSLPSEYGIGDLGPVAYEFAKEIKKTGFSIWQILPLNPLGYGNSPYQPYASYGGDPIYISLELLAEEGYLQEVPESTADSGNLIDYKAVREFKEKYLRQAYEKFSPDEGYVKFLEESWVFPYGVFMMLKEKHEGECWTEWDEDEKQWKIQKEKNFTEEEKDEIHYQMFLQYVFYHQWIALKRYINSLGIKVMGDIPFYVGLDSVDVWTNPESFLLDTTGHPLFIAGVPPDYFSPTGQRWGNPIYDWEHLTKTGYSFWIRRIGYNSEMYDILRIDHFRAFDTYWKIPASCPTAMVGEWVEAPGYEVFDTLLKTFPEIELVMEDLGELREEVGILRDHYDFKGMKVYQFTLDPEKEEKPDKKQLIIYTGTHDNQTTKGWFLSQTEEMQEKILKYLEKKGYTEKLLTHRFIHDVFDSEALMAVIPLQDVIGLDDSGRINTPGTVGSPNWEWHLSDLDGFREQELSIRKLIEDSRRIQE